MNRSKTFLSGLVTALVVALGAASPALAQPTAKKPNILVIWGDDIGGFNISAYNLGMMGYRTPNIDRIAKEGALFTDWYGQQSCTAGRAAFITGQSPIRTGLTKVGLPGAPEGMKKEDPTIATLLRAQGYMTGQFGKNHLGDRDEMLPTNHGFDEFFGNLYHLNAEEEPENPDYPKDPAFKKKFGPRGVIHSFADGRITDTGPLTKKRMETIDEEVTAKALDFMDAREEGGQAVLPLVELHPHAHLHAPEGGVRGQDRPRHLRRRHGRARRPRRPGARQAQGARPRREHHRHVLHRQRRRDLHLARRRHDDVPRREEHAVGGRLPRPDAHPLARRHQARHGRSTTSARTRTCCRRCWPRPATPTVKEDLLKGRTIGGTTYKVHLDGYNLLPALKGEAAWPRKEFIYWTDDGSVAALRYDNWKITFLRAGRRRPARCGRSRSRRCARPLLTNLRMDPFERAEDENAMGYQRWYMEHMFLIAPAGAYVGQWLQSFREFPPRQKPGSFNLDRVMEAVHAAARKQ